MKFPLQVYIPTPWHKKPIVIKMNTTIAIVAIFGVLIVLSGKLYF